MIIVPFYYGVEKCTVHAEKLEYKFALTRQVVKVSCEKSVPAAAAAQWRQECTHLDTFLRHSALCSHPNDEWLTCVCVSLHWCGVCSLSCPVVSPSPVGTMLALNLLLASAFQSVLSKCSDLLTTPQPLSTDLAKSVSKSVSFCLHHLYPCSFPCQIDLVMIAQFNCITSKLLYFRICLVYGTYSNQVIAHQSWGFVELFSSH